MKHEGEKGEGTGRREKGKILAFPLGFPQSSF